MIFFSCDFFLSCQQKGRIKIYSFSFSHMASTTPKTPCLTCGKAIGLFKCEGCSQTFCTKHVVEHRQTLHHQLDEVIITHDLLQQTLSENQHQNHPLINSVDEWEQKSIEKIQRIANDVRQQFVTVIHAHKGQRIIDSNSIDFEISFLPDKISEELNSLSKRIKKAREDDDFFETDLQTWTLTLEELKQELIHVPSINNIKEDPSEPLIYQLQWNEIMVKNNKMKPKTENCDDLFHECLDAALIEDNGRLIVHKNSNTPVEIRGRNEYSSGLHQFRFQIENNPLQTWIFFGIQTSTIPMTRYSYQTPSAYGWADFNDFFLGGVRQNGQGQGQFSQTQENDIILIVFNCDNRTISYTNERTQRHQKLNIDLNKCPFPWKLHINMFGAHDRVRLLNAISSS